MEKVEGEMFHKDLGNSIKASYDGEQVWLRLEETAPDTGEVQIHSIALKGQNFQELVKYFDFIKYKIVQFNTSPDTVGHA